MEIQKFWITGFCVLAASSLCAQEFSAVDLSAHVQKRWEDIEPNTSWAAVPRGSQTIGGVPFKLDGIIEVTGMGAARAGEPKPAQVTAIPADARATHIHILHGTGYAAPDGTPIAVLTLHYANGESRFLPVSYGTQVRNWWQEPGEQKSSVSDKNSEIAWTGGSPQTDPMGVKLRLFKTRFVNPRPDQEIRRIDFSSLFSQATPVLVGLALERNSPGDLEEAQRLSNTARELLDTQRAGVTFDLLFKNSTQRPRSTTARLKVQESGRSMDLGFFQSDKPSQLKLYFPNTVDSLEYSLFGLDFVSHHGKLEKKEDIFPSRLEILLDRGTTIGGVVQTPAGEPIPGAKVVVTTVERDAVGQFVSQPVAEIKTDHSGRWKSSSVPPNFTSLSFEVTHPDYRSGEFVQGEEQDPEILTKQNLLSAKASMVLKPAPALTGTVLGANGTPLAGANILVRVDERRSLQTSSNERGAFSQPILSASDITLVVQAPGHAPFLQQVSLGDDPPLLSIRLRKGSMLKGRVLDSAKTPLAGVDVSVTSWNDLPVLNWRAQTDSDGRWSWDSAPVDPVVLSFSKPGYQRHSTSFSSSSEEHELQLEKTFKLSGKVLDAETKKPISSFKVIRGQVWGGPEENARWEPESAQTAQNGEYLVEQSDSMNGQWRFMIRAEGYQPVASPVLSPVGWHTFDAELPKARPPVGTVKNQQGKPVEKAAVATLGTGYLMLSAGTFRTHDRTRPFVETDDDGRFELEEALGDARVIFVHKEFGYAESSIDKLRGGAEILLQPWAKIDGQLKIGSNNAGAGHDVMLAPLNHGPGELSYDYDQYSKTTDENGRFTIQFVPPGERQVVRLIPIGRGKGWSHYTRFTIAPGETKSLQVGGVGRPIIGKLATTNPDRKVNWKSGHHNLGTRWPQPPRFTNPEDARKWQSSPEMLEARKKFRSYTLEVAEDGTFRIADVLPGEYTLRVHLTEPGGDDSGPLHETFLGSTSKDLVVDEIPSGQTNEPMDIGTLTIQLKNEVKTGMTAPPIDAKTLDDQPFNLKDLAGKFVLLDFWATWCGPCVAEVPNLKAAFEKHGKNPNFVMVGLSLDKDSKEPIEFVKNRKLDWTQVFLGEWSKTSLPDAYGVTGIPATFLVNPEGKIIATNLRGENLIQTLDRFLTRDVTANKN